MYDSIFVDGFLGGDGGGICHNGTAGVVECFGLYGYILSTLDRGIIRMVEHTRRNVNIPAGSKKCMGVLCQIILRDNIQIPLSLYRGSVGIYLFGVQNKIRIGNEFCSLGLKCLALKDKPLCLKVSSGDVHGTIHGDMGLGFGKDASVFPLKTSGIHLKAFL